MKKIIGDSFYSILQYGSKMDVVIKRNDMELIERNVETKTTDYMTIFFFKKNFIVLSASLFSMMISWVLIITTVLDFINKKESPGLYAGLFMLMYMLYMGMYISSVFLISRGIFLGLKIINITFHFMFAAGLINFSYYLYGMVSFVNFDLDYLFSSLCSLIFLYLSRYLMNTNLVKVAILWTIEERARKAYLKLFAANYQRRRKKRKLRVG